MTSTARPSIDIFRHADDAIAFSAGSTVFTEGEQADVMYAVKSGVIDLRVRGELVDTVEAGGIIGEMAVLGDQPRSATATVAVDAELVPITQERFVFLVQQTPFFAIEVMRVLADRLRAMNERI